MNQVGQVTIPAQVLSSGERLPIAVIGAGFSGTMVSIHLANWLPPEQPVLLCESGEPCRGPAYGTPNAGHLLNVRAANMSAFPRQPEHFDRWLATVGQRDSANVCDTEAGRFASRGLYGRYLSFLLETVTASYPDRLSFKNGEVVDIVPEGGAHTLSFADGRTMPVAGVVLAIGNLPAQAARTPLYRTNPWAPGTLDGLRPDLPVLIVGTGLTMVDLALDLRRTGFGSNVIALSRRGLLPHWHAATKFWIAPEIQEVERRSVLSLLCRIRAEIREAEERGIDWRSVIDGLRPITSALWQAWSEPERRRFLRHVRPYWDIHRHRLAAPVADALLLMMSEGFLEIRRGRILDFACRGDAAHVSIRPRGDGPLQTLTVQRIVNATGLESAARANSPLIGNLRRRGLIRLDPLEMGLDVTGQLQVRDARGAVVPGLWALGPIVRGVFWECVAVPDIRIQAAALAETIAASAIHAVIA